MTPNKHIVQARRLLAQDEGYKAAHNYCSSRRLAIDVPKPVNPFLEEPMKMHWQEEFDEVCAKHEPKRLLENQPNGRHYIS